MDDFDEDVDPLVGPVADLMAEHNLSSTTAAAPITNIKKPNENIAISTTRIKFFDLLSYLNLRSHFREIFTYLLNKLWYYYLYKTFLKTNQEIVLNYPTTSNLIIIFLIYSIFTFTIPLFFHIFLFFFFIIDFLIPLYIYYTWFHCLQTIRQFLHTIQTHQQWLIQIHGFQLIRPTSSLFDNQLYQLRRQIFEELQKHFLLSRQIARQYSTPNEQLICYIGLEEFGPLIQSNPIELEKLTNHFDQISINSILKLSHLQINECIQLIHLNRPNSYWIFDNFQKHLFESMKILNKIKQNCSIMIDYIDLEKHPSTKRLISSYFLLRSNCEQLFQMNENNSLDYEQLKRIIQDLKTVVHSLEAMQSRPMVKINEENSEELLTKENNQSNITSYHRFDDQIEESTDEILICHTGKSANNDDDKSNDTFDIDDYEKRLLHERTNCLMKELQTAIQGKKQEWNEREQRLLGTSEQEEVQEIEKEIIDEEPFEKLSSMSDTISMLDELKHTFTLNRKKLNINEDIFGEEEIEDFGDDDDDDDD
ncbi:hypothetical protein I4U23_014271 [Adineta vaga]|nr:hypothetical protein I4U23_014271 [Adineta vaga]